MTEVNLLPNVRELLKEGRFSIPRYLMPEPRLLTWAYCVSDTLLRAENTRKIRYNTELLDLLTLQVTVSLLL